MLSPAAILRYKVALIKDAQAHGYLVKGTRAYAGKIPLPRMGKYARATLRAFQTRNHLKVTGTLDSWTQAKLIPPAPVNPNVAAAEWLSKYIGPKEQYGENDGPWLRQEQDAIGDSWMHAGHQPYCAEIGGRAAYHHVGVDLRAEFPHLNNAYCPSYEAAINAGTVSVSGKWKWQKVTLLNIRQGDVVLFDWERDGVADHFGRALSTPAYNYLATIEANTGGPQGEGVWKCTRSISLIRCAGRLVPA